MFKSLKLKNFRAFDDCEIECCVPDDENEGSGLNIFVGKNGTGKTSVLEAVSLLGETGFSAKNRIQTSDFNVNEPFRVFEIVGVLNNPFDYRMPDPWKRELLIEAIKLRAKYRDSKTPNKPLSPQFSIYSLFEPTDRSPDWWDEKERGGEISDYFLAHDPDRPGFKGLNFFFFGRDRDRQSKEGYYTFFSRAMEDLTWRYIKGLDDGRKENITTSWENFAQEVIPDNLGDDVLEICRENFGDHASLMEVGLHCLDLKEPFKNAFFGSRKAGEMGAIPLTSMGSGVDLIFTTIFLTILARRYGGELILCIDEPEASLHPQWQKAFFNFLKKESKNTQIFLSTHSPYFFEPDLIGNVRKFDLDGGRILLSRIQEGDNYASERLLELENREVLFSEKVVLVEGVTDRIRLQKFIQWLENELGSKNIPDIFVIRGVSRIDDARQLCEQLNIEFRAVVDLDYILEMDTTNSLMPELSRKELEDIQELRDLEELYNLADANSNEGVKKQVYKLKQGIEKRTKTCLISKIVKKREIDEKYSQKIEEKIKELRGAGIFVLPQGDIEDYLDKDGAPHDDEKKRELVGILGDIDLNLHDDEGDEDESGSGGS